MTEIKRTGNISFGNVKIGGVEFSLFNKLTIEDKHKWFNPHDENILYEAGKLDWKSISTKLQFRTIPKTYGYRDDFKLF